MSDTQTEHHEANRAFYDRISSAYDALSDANEHTARETGEKALGLKPGEVVLEVGFGTGNSVIDLARMVGPTGTVHGIDVSTGMLNFAQKKIDKEGLTDTVKLCVGDARKLPYDDSTFDAAFMSFTLELFPEEDTPGTLAEVRRVLKPGGRFGVVSMSVPSEGERSSMLEHIYVWMHRHFPHIVDCRPIDVAGTLKSGGFEIVSAEELKIWSMPVGVVIARKS